MRQALNLYLEEPEGSTQIFPPPSRGPFARDVVEVEVEPAVAFPTVLRELRIRSKLTQKEAASRLGMPSLYSYQRLERRSNPTLAAIRRVKALFPGFPLEAVLDG